VELGGFVGHDVVEYALRHAVLAGEREAFAHRLDGAAEPVAIPPCRSIRRCRNVP